MKQSRYLTAKEVAETLNVSRATVYAYVSRQLIRSEPAGTNSKERLYLAEDVQKLLERKEFRREPSKVANRAMHWGMPILESELTLIDENGLYYRGYDVMKLAIEHTIEQVAALLWTGNIEDEKSIFTTHLPLQKYLRYVGDYLSPLQKLTVVLTYASGDDLAAYDLDTGGGNVYRAGARILTLMSAVLAGGVETAQPIGRMLQEAWFPSEQQTAHLFNVVLILCADHELNVSSFAARVVASAEANLYQVVSAGLAAIQGFKHGGATVLVEALLQEVSESLNARKVIAERLQKGMGIPGFGHRLYPDGDPRGALLLKLIGQVYPDAPAVHLANMLVAIVREITDKRPTIDFALATLTYALQLPNGTALALFALGRTVGWIAHALEQYRSGQMIRPRARYVGLR